eukprot:1620617-Amphidinium_carterae.1
MACHALVLWLVGLGLPFWFPCYEIVQVLLLLVTRVEAVHPRQQSVGGRSVVFCNATPSSADKQAVNLCKAHNHACPQQGPL